MIDRPLFLVAVTLIVIGIVFSYSLSAYTVLLYDAKPYHFLVRQLAAGLLGIVLMWFIARQDPAKVIPWLGFSIFLVSVAMMLAMPFLPESIAHAVGGAKRWIRLGPVSVAPVELFKVGFVYFLAWSFSRKLMVEEADHKRLSFKEEFWMVLPYLVVFAAFMFLIAVFQNDLGQVMVLAITLLFMLILAGRSMRIFLLIFFAAALAMIFFIVTSPHRIERFKGWFYMLKNLVAKLFPSWAEAVPSVNLAEEPYQVANSLNAIHHGGLFGVGLGNGILKLGFLSEVHTDFVLAGMAEEIGVVGVMAVTGLLFFVIYRLMRIAGRVDQPLYSLYCAGLAMIVGFAFLINALGISGVIPLKGIAVPFLSYGGSQVVALSIGLGMALSMSKRAKI